MKCPTCIDTEMIIRERSGVEIDSCPRCRGVWLDRGELDKMIERAEREWPKSVEEDEDDDRRYRDRGRSGHYDPKQPREKKSFWSEFFD